jgi:hypothetical protein
MVSRKYWTIVISITTMNSKPGIILKKPDQWLGKMFKVKVDKGNVGKFIGKVFIDVITSDAKNAFKDCVDFAAAIGIAQEPGEIAWTLIYSALTQAMANLVEDNQDLFQLANQGNEINTDEIQFSQCLERLETEEITIYQDFFQRPQDFYIVTEIKTPFAEFLQTTFNFNPAQAQAISNRLPDEFLDALYTEAAKHSEKYSKLQTKFNNLFNLPAEQKAQQKLTWRRYSAWLQKQVTERMFFEPFGLKLVYVPLRAYYQEKIGDRDDDEFPSSYRSYQREDQNIKRIVVELEPELQTWLEQADKDDAIRVISGGPGSGKSSFAKMFAAKQAEKGEIPVLFIPLHLFDPEDDLVEAIGKFIDSMRDIPLPPNPLKKENFVDKLLIIFDGLDELAMQGKIAEEIAQKFISEVRRQVDLFNVVETRLLVVIGGREIVVQKNKSEFRKPRNVESCNKTLHLEL